MALRYSGTRKNVTAEYAAEFFFHMKEATNIDPYRRDDDLFELLGRNGYRGPRQRIIDRTRSAEVPKLFQAPRQERPSKSARWSLD